MEDLETYAKAYEARDVLIFGASRLVVDWFHETIAGCLMLFVAGWATLTTKFDEWNFKFIISKVWKSLRQTGIHVLYKNQPL